MKHEGLFIALFVVFVLTVAVLGIFAARKTPNVNVYYQTSAKPERLAPAPVVGPEVKE